MILNLLKSFLPWIIYFVLIGPTPHQMNMAIIAASIAFLFYGFKELKQGFILSWGTGLFFLFMIISILLLKNTWIANHEWLFSNGTLATIAWISLIIGKPFTLQYARLQVPKEKWNHPIFIKINQIITIVWGSIFLLCIIIPLSQLYFPYSFPWIYDTMTNGLTIFGVMFTVWFPKWYRKKQTEVRQG